MRRRRARRLAWLRQRESAARLRPRESITESDRFRARALLGLLAVCLGLGILGARFVYLQVYSYEELHTRSERNRVKPRPIVPARGLIYDRNGILLADNVPAYRLELVPEQVKDLAGTVAGLTEVLGLSEDELERFAAARQGKRRFQPVPIRLRLSEAEVARFAVERHRFPGVDVVPYLTRQYPLGELMAHVVGYVGRIDASDVERLDPVQYRDSTHVGKSGIERFYETRLHGRVGYEEVETNAEGRVLRVLRRVPAVAGEHLYLSIDAQLQAQVAAAFEGQPGSAVAIDPRSGEVLAMVNVPSFDPNLFVQGMSRSQYAELLSAPHRPLFNRAVLGGYGPGSTLKPFIGLAGLESGLRRPGDRILSTGAFRLQGHAHEYRDWRKGGHGWIDLSESIAQSVNTYYYQLALDLGIERLAESMARFGFGAATGVDLAGEGSGVLPSRQWKRERLNQPWFPGETVITGIGQGYWVTTPLQLAQATAVLASGGTWRTPHLLRATRAGFEAPVEAYELAPPRQVLGSDPRHLKAVVDGMVATMHGETGTARAAAAGAPYRIAGKTGTAQRVGRTGSESLDPARLAEHLRHQALFVGFAPAEDPRIAIAVVVEHGGSGSRAAAPIARRIFDAWLLREAQWTSR
jgi:penicillin-binding protein 2